MKANTLFIALLGAAFLAGCSTAATKKLNSIETGDAVSAIQQNDLQTLKRILEPKGDISSESYLLEYAVAGPGCLDNSVGYLLQKGIKPNQAQLGNSLNGGCYRIAEKIGSMLSPGEIDSAVTAFAQRLSPPACCKGVTYGGEDGSEQCATQFNTPTQTKPIEDKREAGTKLLSIVDGLCSKNSAYCTAGDRLRSSRISYEQAVSDANACNMEILAKASSDREAAAKARDEFYARQEAEIARQEREEQAVYESNPKNIEVAGCAWFDRIRMFNEILKTEKEIAAESGVTALRARFQGVALKKNAENNLKAVQAKYRQKFGQELNLNNCK